MSDGGGEGNIIIVKKIVKGGGGHHGGAWKVAYADFVTAMMALFIVLWILGQSPQVKQAVSAYFKDPIGFTTNKGKFILQGGGGTQKSIVPMEVNVQRAEQQLKQIQRQKMEATGQELMKELSNVPEFKELLKKITIEYTEDGMRIEIIETDDVFFEIGTSKLKRAAAELLKKIGENLAKKNNKIVLEGHTDSRPFPGSGFGYTNFELSADRANASRRGLLAGGVTNNQIDEIRGFADKRLRDAKDPYSASNRRISILVKYDKTY